MSTDYSKEALKGNEYNQMGDGFYTLEKIFLGILNILLLLNSYLKKIANETYKVDNSPIFKYVLQWRTVIKPIKL